MIDIRKVTTYDVEIHGTTLTLTEAEMAALAVAAGAVLDEMLPKNAAVLTGQLQPQPQERAPTRLLEASSPPPPTEPPPAPPTYHKGRWSHLDEDELRRMWQVEKYSFEEICARFPRSPHNISDTLMRLGVMTQPLA